MKLVFLVKLAPFYFPFSSMPSLGAAASVHWPWPVCCKKKGQEGCVVKRGDSEGRRRRRKGKERTKEVGTFSMIQPLGLINSWSYPEV